MNEAIKLNRKQRRRADAKVERIARDAHRREAAAGGVIVPRGEIEQMRVMQGLFTAIVKEQGRVRIPKATLDALSEGDRVTSRDGGDAVILTYVAGDPAQEGQTG